MDGQQFKKGDLLTRTECMQLFMERMRISKKTYYDNFHKHIKFKSYGQKEGENGEMVNTLYRIPYEITLGLIHLLKEQPKPEDPPAEKLVEFMNDVPEGILNE